VLLLLLLLLETLHSTALQVAAASLSPFPLCCVRW